MPEYRWAWIVELVILLFVLWFFAHFFFHAV